MATEFVKNFNELLESLIKQVDPMVGKNYYILFKGLTKVNSLLPINEFYTYAHTWKKEIEAKDESFFLNEHNIKNHTDDEKALDEIFHLTNIWTKLDKESKDNLWEIFQGLFYLAEEYHKLKN